MVNEDQGDVKAKWKPRKGGEVLVRPVTMKQINTFLRDKIGVESADE